MKQVEAPLKSIFAFPQKLFLLMYTCNYQMLNIQGPVCVVPLLGSFHCYISTIAWKQGKSQANCFLCTQKHCIYSHGTIKTSISTLERQWEEGAVFNSRMKGKNWELWCLFFLNSFSRECEHIEGAETACSSSPCLKVSLHREQGWIWSLKRVLKGRDQDHSQYKGKRKINRIERFWVRKRDTPHTAQKK